MFKSSRQKYDRKRLQRSHSEHQQVIVQVGQTRSRNFTLFYTFSMSGHRIPNLPPSQSCAIYSSSKHALTVISEGLRRELVSKNADIKVTVIIRRPDQCQ